MRKRNSWTISRDVTFALIQREVKGKFGANRLGAFWFLFEPLAHIGVLIAIYVFVRAHQASLVNLPLFLATGVIPFLLFKNIALKGMEAVSANKALFSYRQIKPFDTVYARAIVECVLMACVYILVMCVMGVWMGNDVRIYHPLEWVFYAVAGIVLSFGLALIYCVIGEAFPESKSLIRLIYMPLYFISGVIVPLWIIPDRFVGWILWNPYVHIIDGMRKSTFLIYPETRGISPMYAISAAVVVLFIGISLYRVRRLKLVAS